MRSFWRLVAAACFGTYLVALPASAEARYGSRHPDSSARADVFDYYVLALSWSPTYCLSHAKDRQQCGPSRGYGFVLHGLWPQYASGGYPQRCPARAKLDAEAVAFGKTIFPSPKLVFHEWDTHGTCSGLGALDYFKAADRARTRVVIPAHLEAPQQTQHFPAQAIVDAFVEANRFAHPDSVTVTCSGPALSEIRVCLDTNLRPTSCKRGVATNCRNGPIRIPAVR